MHVLDVGTAFVIDLSLRSRGKWESLFPVVMHSGKQYIPFGPVQRVPLENVHHSFSHTKMFAA